MTFCTRDCTIEPVVLDGEECTVGYLLFGAMTGYHAQQQTNGHFGREHELGIANWVHNSKHVYDCPAPKLATANIPIALQLQSDRHGLNGPMDMNEAGSSIDTIVSL